MRKKLNILEQLMQQANEDMIIATVTVGKDKHYLPITAKVATGGKHLFIAFNAVAGIYRIKQGDNLAFVAPNQDIEAEFFPEKAKELALLNDLAKKYGYKLATSETFGESVVRQRAPRGSKPKIEPKGMPSVGDKFVYSKDGMEWEVAEVNTDAKTLVIASGTEKKEITHIPMFWRWYSKVG